MKDTGERLIAKGHKKSLAYGEHSARYATALVLVENKVVLDIACGTGYGTKMLSEKAKCVVGMDISGESIKYAQENYPGDNIEYKVGDAQKIPLEDNSIDVVTSLETIEHLPDPEKFVKEVKRILKPGGLFVVSTPNDDEYTEGNVFHVHEFDFKELSTLINRYFKNHKYYYQGSWYTSGVLSRDLFTKSFRESPVGVSKSFSQSSSKAVYFIAAASDGDVGELSENIMIADVFSEKLSQQNQAEVVSHIKELDYRVAQLQSAVGRMNGENLSLRSELEGIHSSKAWRIVKRAYGGRNALLKIKKRLRRS